MLPYFESDHLPDHLKVISKPFEKLLILMHELIVDCDSSTAMDFEQFEIGVHDLLRAKDCFVRARLSMDQ